MPFKTNAPPLTACQMTRLSARLGSTSPTAPAKAPYVLASLRALHLDLRLVASDQATVEEASTPAFAPLGWGYFKPTSEVSDLGWGHFRPSRWVHLEASQPAAGVPSPVSRPCLTDSGPLRSGSQYSYAVNYTVVV